MRTRSVLTLLFLFLLSAPALRAQDPQSTTHRTIQLDSVDLIQIDVVDTLRTETWEGSRVMIETTVELIGGKQSLLEYFTKAGRWETNDTTQAKTLYLASADPERRTIKLKGESVVEQVTVVVYLPKIYEPAGPRQWRRKEE